MISGLGLVCVNVSDYDEAKAFYIDKLGCTLSFDESMEGNRFLLVFPPNQPDLQIMFTVPGPPLIDESTAETMRDLLAKGRLSVGGFATDDCRKSYEDLKAKGVEFVEEPSERFYGVDAGFRDPFGNHWRLTQVKPMGGA
jgi:catechol 2,3-dioxygenase-like lactoylglutathione lyase family enzyme